MVQKYVYKIFVFLVGVFFTLPTHAEDYQRATQILDCTVKINTVMRDYPDPQAEAIEELETNQILQIVGKQGNWFDVQSQTHRGWISTFYVDVVGVSRNQKIKKMKKPKPMSNQQRNQTDEIFFNSLRLLPYMSYAFEGKGFYDQFRAGLYATFKTNEFFSVGLLAEGVFFRGTYLGVGPTFHRVIPNSATWFNPSIQASFLYYRFSHSGDEDRGYGIQWVFENDLPLIQKPKFVLKPVLRGGFDLMILNVDQVRVPFFISLGISTQF
ncbi:MAG: SH3 domain-containing protein [Bdellovibrionales bacterium]|nr:SH3 domain-containing protein [Bdellovibrionales bacterium]